MLELLERCIMAVLFEMVNNSATYDAVDKAQDLGWFENGVGYRVQMVRHDDISINRKTR
jgi:hypothetical protein